jgi:hypothetical protein
MPENEEGSNTKNTDFLWKVLGRYDFYIGSTNAKAALLIAYNTFLISGIILKWKDILPCFTSHPKFAMASAVLLFLLAIFSIISLVFTFRTINPYTKTCRQPGKYHSKIFFSDVSQFENADSYLESVKSSSQENLFEDLAKQTYVVARGVDGKFTELKKATGAILFFQIPALTLMLLVNLITHIIDI